MPESKHKTPPLLFDSRTRIHVNALCLGERIDLKPFDASGRLAASPLILAAGGSGCAGIFRYGVVVLFGLDAAEEAAFLANIRPFVHDALEKPIREDAWLLLDANASEQVKTDGIVLHEASVERIQVLADIMAKSVALERYEISMQEGFERIEPLASGLKKHGSTTTSSKDLLRSIGNALLIEHRMVNRIEIGDKPELLWELADLEPLHTRLVREYE
ncbi:MAG: RMD1 family protein, partial [Candidatus Hydrogenedentes bacterium]|nr:RMD1 family protein [Candidatus Hydrogenedentota bacterium]